MAASNAINNATTNAPTGADRELVFSRVFDAPRELVFQAWTDPKHMAQWWGPTGYTTPICEVDARPGGAMSIHMRGPDGTIYPTTGVYQEIVPPERIVFSEQLLDEDGNPLLSLRNTVTLIARGDKTLLTVHSRVVQSTVKGAQYLAGMETGWTQTLDRLAKFLAEA